MLKKTITFEDFNGNTVSEDHFFHLSKAELVELEMSHEGGLSEALKTIIASEDNQTIIKEFKNILLNSYGQRSDDGRRFIKTPELRAEFESSEAYSALFMELITDTDAAVEFINGIVPKGMQEEAAKLTQVDTQPTLAPVPEPETVTRADLARMSNDEFKAISARIQSGEVVIAE